MTAIALRRMSSSFPLDLQNELRDYLRVKPVPRQAIQTEEDELLPSGNMPAQESTDENSGGPDSTVSSTQEVTKKAAVTKTTKRTRAVKNKSPKSSE
jgi:hypothetical protein